MGMPAHTAETTPANPPRGLKADCREKASRDSREATTWLGLGLGLESGLGLGLGLRLGLGSGLGLRSGSGSGLGLQRQPGGGHLCGLTQ